MNKTLALFFLLFACNMGFAQSFCDDTNTASIRIDGCSDVIKREVALFNKMVQYYDLQDTIAYACQENEIVYSLNGKTIPNPFFDMKGKYKPWDHQMKNHGNSLLLEYFRGNSLNAYIPGENGTGVLMQFGINKTARYKSLQIFETHNYLPDGKYEKRNCSGRLVVQGYFKNVDTLYSYSYKGFDPNTYEEKIIEKVVDHKTIRTGTWKYFDDAGNLILEERYPGKSNWLLASEYLCTTDKNEWRAMTRNTSNSFMVFNTLCQVAGFRCWISEYQVADQKEYYFNGKPIAAPEIESKPNYVDDIKLSTPDAEIHIITKSNNYAALGNREKKIKLNLRASIKYKNGKGEKLTFSGEKLVRFQTSQGLKQGLYQEMSCSGTLLIQGQYTQIDSLYRDTVATFNPDTYEEIIQVTEHKAFEKKCGVWQYFDAKGVLLREENYDECQ